jgi:hypothetical protein
MPRLFISYRRQDAPGIAGRIYDRLRDHFGREAVFMDLDSIPFGVDFREHLQKAVGERDILIAVIGPRWAGDVTDGHRRLDDPKDFVRIEIETALEQNIPVIPVLIEHMRMPGEAELSPSLAWHTGTRSRSTKDGTFTRMLNVSSGASSTFWGNPIS